MKKQILLFSFLIYTFSCYAQVDYTANDQVNKYQTPFLLGVNPGSYDGWDDEGLADLVAGNSTLGIRGAGVKTQRVFLPEWFLEDWGYDIRVDEMEYFETLGLKEHTVFIGYPTDKHRSLTEHCEGIRSELFANLYEPIWDDGANGTPINENNYYANYVYQLALAYKDFVKIYEVWNEPDFDYSGNGYKGVGEAGNWFENVPEPCDISLRAPITEYVRTLRITYEVVKSISPDAYISVGGLGFESFLDLILRHTDNPASGTVSNEFPLTGGAYFDVLSYHSYPHFNGSMRDWDNDLGQFVYTRHSDRGVEGLINHKNRFQAVLHDYGYNGGTYPEKIYVNTESNLPRIAFDEFIGSEEAQTNYLMKTQVACLKNDIQQFHVYQTAESKSEANMWTSFHAMGFYKDLDNVSLHNQIENECVLASATTTHFLLDKKYDKAYTESLSLPSTIDGGVFCENNGDCVIVLWAKTSIDQSEFAQATYSFPSGLEFSNLQRYEWDEVDHPSSNIISSENIALTGRPSFFIASGPTSSVEIENSTFTISPNLVASGSSIHVDVAMAGQVKLINLSGKILSEKEVRAGKTQFSIPAQLSSGTYILEYLSIKDQIRKKIVVTK